MAEVESRDDGIIAPMKRGDAAALAKAATVGLAVSEALHLISHTATAESALNELRGAKGRGDIRLPLTRPQAAALAAVAETGLAVTRAVDDLAVGADLDGAQRGLDALRGAMR